MVTVQCLTPPYLALWCRWACWGGMHQEAWSWRSRVLPWAWRCQPQERTEWAADETAAISRTQCPPTHPETWGRYSFWRDARVRYLAGVSWKKTLAELVGIQPLKWRLEDSQNAKKSWSQKKLACADSTCTTNWMVWYRNFGLLPNALLNVSRVLNSKCPKQRA